MIFRKWGGGRSKAVWNFSKNSSVLVRTWAKIWNFGKRGKIKKSYLGVFTNIHDLYLRWTLIFQWLLIEFLHKILKKIILKTAFYKSSNCVKFQDILWNRFSFDFLVFSGIFFHFLKASLCEMPIKGRNGSSGEYIGQNMYQSGPIFFCPSLTKKYWKVYFETF